MYWLKVISASKDFDVCIGEIYAGQTVGFGKKNERDCTVNRYREIGCVVETWSDSSSDVGGR